LNILENKPAAYRFSMKTRQGQEQLTRARVGLANPRANNFNRPLRSLAAPSHPAIHLRPIVETAPCSAVIEERNRMAREIHDTLTQEFAGILLHLEAVNGLDASENASEYLARHQHWTGNWRRNQDERAIVGLNFKGKE
jgi:signal transduction histidine kinase